MLCLTPLPHTFFQPNAPTITSRMKSPPIAIRMLKAVATTADVKIRNL